MIPLDEITKAAERIKPYLTQTPCVRSRHFGRRFGAQIFLKLENLNPTRSFKVRGAFNAILSAPKEARKKGVVTASGGNHGLGVALACQSLGLEATVFLPLNVPDYKVLAIKDLGAKVIIHGQAWDEANQAAKEEARRGLVYVHPFNDPKVMAGQATIMSEIVEQLGRVDLVLASIGGGGLISGILSAARQISKGTKVVGVETKGADCMHQSIKKGRLVTLDSIDSICESLGAKSTEPAQYDMVSKYAHKVVAVTDNQAVESLWDVLENEKMLVEPAASCLLAALEQESLVTRPGMKVALVICGGNISLNRALDFRGQAICQAG